MVLLSGLPVPAVAAQLPGVYLDGAEPWVASDCDGDVPIVVGSDAAAQSDIYSAVTLAGIVGTDCVVLAGPRDADMPATQQARLDNAADGGYVVGGLAAVPDAKLAGRDMTRLAGTTRWDTAQLVGNQARNLADDTPDSMTTDPPSWTFTSVAAGLHRSCGLRADDTIVCWGANRKGYGDREGHSDAPPGEFTTFSTGRYHSCGLRTDRTVTCWGSNSAGQADAPSGTFATLGLGIGYSCGLRTDHTIACWGNNDHGQSDAPPGQFTAISIGQRHSCGLRTNRTAICWGANRDGQTNAPSGTFTAISLDEENSCGIRSDGALICWGSRPVLLPG